jgi:hypothetical protein
MARGQHRGGGQSLITIISLQYRIRLKAYCSTIQSYQKNKLPLTESQKALVQSRLGFVMQEYGYAA